MLSFRHLSTQFLVIANKPYFFPFLYHHTFAFIIYTIYTFHSEPFLIFFKLHYIFLLFSFIYVHCLVIIYIFKLVFHLLTSRCFSPLFFILLFSFSFICLFPFFFFVFVFSLRLLYHISLTYFLLLFLLYNVLPFPFPICRFPSFTYLFPLSSPSSICS